MSPRPKSADPINSTTRSLAHFCSDPLIVAGGPLASASRQPLLYKIASLAAGDAITWQAGFRVTGPGHMSVQVGRAWLRTA